MRMRVMARVMAWAIVEKVPAYHTPYEPREGEGGGVVHSYILYSFVHY